jgi:hypothetical protein
MRLSFHREPISIQKQDENRPIGRREMDSPLPLMLALARLAAGLEPLSVPGAFAPLAPSAEADSDPPLAALDCGH